MKANTKQPGVVGRGASSHPSSMTLHSHSPTSSQITLYKMFVTPSQFLQGLPTLWRMKSRLLTLNHEVLPAHLSVLISLSSSLILPQLS